MYCTGFTVFLGCRIKEGHVSCAEWYVSGCLSNSVSSVSALVTASQDQGTETIQELHVPDTSTPIKSTKRRMSIYPKYSMMLIQLYSDLGKQLTKNYKMICPLFMSH